VPLLERRQAEQRVVMPSESGGNRNKIVREHRITILAPRGSSMVGLLTLTVCLRAVVAQSYSGLQSLVFRKAVLKFRSDLREKAIRMYNALLNALVPCEKKTRIVAMLMH